MNAGRTIKWAFRARSLAQAGYWIAAVLVEAKLPDGYLEMGRGYDGE